jgi:hypothetical protein
MGKINEITVSMGRTRRPSDAEEWVREEYTLKGAVEDEAELEAARGHMRGLIEGWLAAPVSKPVAKTPAPLPQLDPDVLAKLPWKTYKSKEDCKSDEAGWIFRNTKGAEALADLIHKQGNSVTVQIARTSFEVRFSGAEKQFIGRAPVKT